MENGNRAKMEEFIHARYRRDGKKIARSILRELSDERLKSILESSPEGAKAFYDSLGPRVDGVENEETRMLRRLVKELAEHPGGMLGVMKLKGFLEELPYETVSDEALSEMIGQIKAVDSRSAMLLLRYSSGQLMHRM